MYQALSQPLNKVAGIGPAIEKRLQNRGVRVLGDLLLHLPKRYLDDRESIAIKDLREGESARISGHISRREARGFGRKRQVTITLSDNDAHITLSFFHSGYMMTDARLAEGQQISVRGVPERWGSRLQMSHPDWISMDRFRPGWQPVYASLAGLSSKRLQSMIQTALTMLPVGASTVLDASLSDFPSLHQALSAVHIVESMDAANQARQRLKLEELLVYLHLMQEKRRDAEVLAPAFKVDVLAQQLIDSLPYPLTHAQTHVWQEIAADLASGKRMHRLLQGDVGAGKTWVAALTMVKVVDAGFQVALMAPTEVLAQQHYQTLKALLEPLNISVALLTGSSKARERKPILAALSDASLSVVIGTHALISDDVIYAKLGLALVDEQHRFGVRQRWALTEKARDNAVHLLGMTATPIPRSLALSLYGDMDLSVMKGMPPGRKPVETRLLAVDRMVQLAEGMSRILAQDGRIYWIVPRIDEDEEGVSVDQRVEVLAKRFPHEKVLGLHGRMKSADKQKALAAFSSGDCRILVSTTVVEVGVDVPEARLMIIEQAENYGLAQLHQLRGRVGRSSEQGYCMLMPSADASPTASERLTLMTNTHDGLELAEADLQQRGGGDAIGVRQSGEAGFRLLDMPEDAAMVRQWHEHLPNFELPEHTIQFWRPLDDSVD